MGRNKDGGIGLINFLTVVALMGLTMVISGCASTARQSPEEASNQEFLRQHKRQTGLPPSVRQIKRLKVYANEKQTETGVLLHNGEFVTLMLAGQINRFWSGSTSPPETPVERPLSWWINGQNFGTTFNNAYGRTILSPASGSLQLGIVDEYHKDNKGFYDVIIVTWSTTNFTLIADFLETLKQEISVHPGVEDAFQQASLYRGMEISRNRTSREIENTKVQMGALLKEITQQNEQPSADLQQREEELESRLVELTGKLQQIDEMNRQLLQEKEKAAQLSQELEDREQRERELMSRISAGVKVPPLLLITSPEDGRLNETDSVRLTGAAEDDQGLMRLDVLVNGRPVESGDARGIRPVEGTAPKRLSFERRIPLAQGANRIQVKATDTDGLTSERGLTVHYATSRRNVWAVVVGINDYPQLPKLKYAVNDAKEFHRLLVEKNRVPTENITLLLNDQASLKNLRSTLGTKLKNAAGLDDMVIIFFAGHGATERDAMSADGDGLEKYLLPYETDPADLYSTAMPMREIAYIFGRIRSDRLIFIADSCYSGASGGRTISVTGTRANITDGFLERISGGRGKVIISASAANEVSVEKDELQHGVFTYYLLEGLRGAADADRDGTVTVDEAYRY
ncbi:MAG TPA: caspase family protein, partial [Desulfobacterales bacterium]|nr:caspase family protein [Desulfobacterales bacterium]